MNQLSDCEVWYPQKQPSSGVLKKRCSENMKPIYRRESYIHEFKDIESFSTLERGPKSNENASAFLKLCFHLR